MQIHTANDLIGALQDSGLFTPEQVVALSAELRALEDDDPSALMRHLIQRDWLTLYQLRKVVHGKAAELHLGPYVVTDKLGEGGMGKVYRAVHVRSGRGVAVKVVRSALLSNPIVQKRYQREIDTARALDHPNVVRVYGNDVAPDGRCFLAMEFVDGIDLARLVREHGVLRPQEAAEYVRQAALGLHHAHEKGIVHRDIKPSNIVVSGERHLPGSTEPAVAKLLDMGLVREVGFDASNGEDLTRAGTVVGTPDYMAPEQAKNSSTVDRRADLYGLGCTFYYLLTGRPPFPDGTAIEKILKHQVDPPPPLQAVRPDVSEELAQVVSKLMAKRPDDRFQSARELADALAPLARYGRGGPPGGGGQPTSAKSGTYPSARQKTPARPRRRNTSRAATPPTNGGPVAPSEPTPRPARGRTQAASDRPFEFLTDAPLGAAPRTRAKSGPAIRTRTTTLVIAVTLALALAVVAGWLVARAVGGKSGSRSDANAPAVTAGPAIGP
jgi:serine/threonine protein kinase